MTMHDFYDDLADDFAADWTTNDTDWTTDTGPGDELATLGVADALRQTMREEFAGASDEEMEFALDSMLDSMSAAEGFNFGQSHDRCRR